MAKAFFQEIVNTCMWRGLVLALLAVVLVQAAWISVLYSKLSTASRSGVNPDRAVQTLIREMADDELGAIRDLPTARDTAQYSLSYVSLICAIFDAKGDGGLREHMAAQGITENEDIAYVALQLVWERLHGKKLDLESKVKDLILYWKQFQKPPRMIWDPSGNQITWVVTGSLDDSSFPVFIGVTRVRGELWRWKAEDGVLPWNGYSLPSNVDESHWSNVVHFLRWEIPRTNQVDSCSGVSP